MKRFFIGAMFLLAAGGLFAQQEVGNPDPSKIGVESAQQLLKEVSVDKFEKDGYWVGRMSQDDGYVTTRLFPGKPQNAEEIEDEAELNIPNEYVLGARVDFLRRSYTSVSLSPIRPIPIEGITKTVSVWAVGRNYNHELYLEIEDFFGRTFELYMGSLNFSGWKQLTVAIPPQSDNGVNGIVQRNFHYNNQMGIKIKGFKIKIGPQDAYGSYYVYLDDLRATTDLYSESSRDPDDMPDMW